MKRLTKYTAVDWMHPSWRDLVIEHLASDDVARGEFLRRCGLQGFLLALSSAGGAKGQRLRPLLIADEDWAALGTSVRRIVSSEPTAIHSVLEALYETFGAETSRGEGGKYQKLVDLTTIALSEIRNVWSKGCITDPAELTRYYTLSEMLPSLVAGPDLHNSWILFREEALDQIENFDPCQLDDSLARVTEWLELTITIAANEPRFLRQVKFIDDQPKIGDLLPILKDRVEHDIDFDEADECRSEQDQLDAFAKLADHIQTLFPTFADPAKSVAFAARLNERRINTRREDLESQPDEDNFDDYLHEQSSAAASIVKETQADLLQQVVSIEQLFQDL